jgi:hypothetical protein
MNFIVAAINSNSSDDRSVSQMILPFMILQNNKGQNNKDETIADRRRERL